MLGQLVPKISSKAKINFSGISRFFESAAEKSLSNLTFQTQYRKFTGYQLPKIRKVLEKDGIESPADFLKIGVLGESFPPSNNMPSIGVAYLARIRNHATYILQQATKGHLGIASWFAARTLRKDPNGENIFAAMMAMATKVHERIHSIGFDTNMIDMLVAPANVSPNRIIDALDALVKKGYRLEWAPEELIAHSHQAEFYRSVFTNKQMDRTSRAAARLAWEHMDVSIRKVARQVVEANPRNLQDTGLNMSRASTAVNQSQPYMTTPRVAHSLRGHRGARRMPNGGH